MMYLKNPYYQLRHNSYCTTEIYVNDVLVSSFKGEATRGRDRSTGFVPINQVVLETGTYEVVGKMSPRAGEEALTADNAYLGLEFYVCDIKNWDATLKQFQPKIESPWGGLSKDINYPHFEIKTEIEIELPYVLDGWQKSENLKDIKEKELFTEVLNTYRQIHAVLASHNAPKFLELSREKMKLQEQAFYFSKERKKTFNDELVKLFGQKLEMEPLNPEDLRLKVMGYGKLVTLVRIDGSAALQFKSPDPKNHGNTEFDIKLHMRNKEKGFSII